MVEVQNLSNLVQDISDLANKLSGERSAILRSQAQKMSDLEKLKEDQIEIQKTKIVLDDLIKKFIGFQLDKIKEYVTYGLKTVITDQNLEFDCEVTTKMNKPWVELLTKNAYGTSENALDAYGGSVAQIESLILRILAVLQLKLYPLLVLDESLNAVSDEYLENTSILMKELSKQLGIKILLITHKKELLSHADKIYKAVETKSGLKFQDIKVTEVLT